jgi:hypothetical protein
MENNGHGSLLKQLLEADEFPILVGKNKARHSVTDFRGRSASFVELEAGRHAVHRLLVSRQQVSGRKAESFEPFGK